MVLVVLNESRYAFYPRKTTQEYTGHRALQVFRRGGRAGGWSVWSVTRVKTPVHVWVQVGGSLVRVCASLDCTAHPYIFENNV